MPLLEDGYVVGAIGVSGASSADEDQELAEIGVASAASNGKATYFPRELVESGGGILLDAGAYKLDAGLRRAPGETELHDRDVDVMHVIEGTARITTGDDEHQLATGDVLAIPSGVPHQFVDVSDPFRYFVVKVEA
jgi:glc operon protein GlcG